MISSANYEIPPTHLILHSNGQLLTGILQLRCNYTVRFIAPIDAASLCEFESDKLWINEFAQNRSR